MHAFEIFLCVALILLGIYAMLVCSALMRKERRERNTDPLFVREVEPGSGVPDGPSTRRLLVALSRGNKSVFTSWMRGEVYDQSRKNRHMTHAESLELAMNPEIDGHDCEIRRT